MLEQSKGSGAPSAGQLGTSPNAPTAKLVRVAHSGTRAKLYGDARKCASDHIRRKREVRWESFISEHLIRSSIFEAMVRELYSCSSSTTAGRCWVAINPPPDAVADSSFAMVDCSGLGKWGHGSSQRLFAGGEAWMARYKVLGSEASTFVNR